MATITTVDAYFDQLPETLQPAARALRQLILQAVPELTESLKWGAPSYEFKGNICYIMAQKKHLNFGFYQGGLLTDPHKLLEGTGAKMRHIKVRNLADIQEAPFGELVQEAVRLEAQPKAAK